MDNSKAQAKKEGNETVTNINQMKLRAYDAKMRPTDVADTDDDVAHYSVLNVSNQLYAATTAQSSFARSAVQRARRWSPSSLYGSQRR